MISVLSESERDFHSVNSDRVRMHPMQCVPAEFSLQSFMQGEFMLGQQEPTLLDQDSVSILAWLRDLRLHMDQNQMIDYSTLFQ